MCWSIMQGLDAWTGWRISIRKKTSSHNLMSMYWVWCRRRGRLLPVMIKQRAGHIINMCSMAGLVATPTYTIYAACKHAVHGFSEALRREVKPWGIEVSMIYPGGVKTEFGEHAGIKRKTQATTPKFLLLSADDVGSAVVQLVRRPRAMWILPWLWSLTALLNKLFPSLVDYTTINKFTIPERADELNAR